MNTIKKFSIPLLLLLLTIVFVFLSVKSHGSHAGADDINHTMIARYSWKYPHLLLDHWGKPFFTLVASPFAQFGNMGTKMMNVIFAILTAFLAYKIATHLNYRQAWLVILMVLFTPIYCVLALTGNIEILAGLIIIATIYFYTREDYIIGNIILSFGFFVRNELFIMIPFFVLYTILKKKYKSIPFVLTGFILYSIIGYFYYHDIFWVITKIPYGNTRGLIGKTSLFHYVNDSKLIFGIPLSILLVIGLLGIAFEFIKNKLSFKTENSVEILLITMPFLAYFCGHSYLFWRATGGSGGALRVMASIAPLAALISMHSLNRMFSLLKGKITLLSYPLMLVLVYFVLVTPFKVDKIPVPDYNDTYLLKKFANWYKNSGYNGNYLIYGDIRLTSYLNIDPYDGRLSRWYLNDHIHPEKWVKDSTIYVWDALFSPNFGKVQLKTVMESPYFHLLKVFKPEVPNKVLGGYDYSIYVFQKLPAADSVNNYQILKELKKKELESFLTLDKIDFENGNYPLNKLSSEAYKGKYAYMMSPTEEFSPTIKIPGKDLQKLKTKYKKMRATVAVRSLNVNDSLKGLYLICSFEKKGKIYSYHNTSQVVKDTLNSYYIMNDIFEIPKIRSRGEELKVYLSNVGHNNLILDDLTVMVK